MQTPPLDLMLSQDHQYYFILIGIYYLRLFLLIYGWIIEWINRGMKESSAKITESFENYENSAHRE